MVWATPSPGLKGVGVTAGIGLAAPLGVGPLAIGGGKAAGCVHRVAAAQQSGHVVGAAAQAFTLAVSAVVAEVGDGSIRPESPCSCRRCRRSRRADQSSDREWRSGCSPRSPCSCHTAVAAPGRLPAAGFGVQRIQKHVIVLGHRVGHHQVIAQAGVQRQLVGELEVVLDVRGDSIRVEQPSWLPPCGWRNPAGPAGSWQTSCRTGRSWDSSVLGMEVSAWLKLKWPLL